MGPYSKDVTKGTTDCEKLHVGGYKRVPRYCATHHLYFILIMYVDTAVAPRPAPPVKKDIKPSYWCVLCRENGALEIYSLPDFKLAFCVRNFAVAPKVLMDSGTIG